MVDLKQRASGVSRRLASAWGAALLLAALLVLVPTVARGQAPADQPAAEATPTPTPAPAPAAEAPAATPSEGSNKGYEEAITVTARKMGAETIQQVPTSIAAPTEDTLRDRGATTLQDVAANVAGFTVQNLGPGQSQVAIRGVSAGQIVRDQPGVKEQVGIYLDESPISMSLFTPDLDLFDLDHVEVLRGPQGTIFGAGSLSGTVRYVTAQPELHSSNSVGELTLNDYSSGSIGGSGKVAFNQPLGDNAAVRVTAFYDDYGGFIDSIQPAFNVKKDVNDGWRGGGRLAFKYQPSDRFTITPRIVYQKVDMNGWNRVDFYNILANPFTTTRPPVDIGDREQFTQIPEPTTDKLTLTDLPMTYTLENGIALTSVTSYMDRKVDVIRDATALTASITGDSIGLPENVYTLDAPLDDHTQAHQWTQELRAAQGAGRLRWVGGGFYGQTKRHYGQDLLVAGFQDLTGIPTVGLRAPKDVLFYSDLHYDLKQFAVFGEATWAATDQLDLTGGLRYYSFDEDRQQIFDGIFAHDNTGTQLVSQPGSTSANGWAPRAIASWKLNQDTTFNAQVAKGFRLGGINDPLNVPLCTPQDLVTFGGHDQWKDETAWNYEVGSKSTIMGGKGTFNASIFYMDISDLQATLTAGTCSSRVIFNVPKARSQGIEVEFTASPTPAFDFAFSGSYDDSELRSTVRDSTGAVVGGIQAGNRLPTVPQLQVSAAATWQHPMMADWLGYLTGVYQHVGSRFTQTEDQGIGFGTFHLRQGIGGPLTQSDFTFDPELPAYDIVNVRYGMVHDKLEIAVFVNNVTDEQPKLSLDRERGRTARLGYVVGEPRTFGVTTRLHF